MWQDVWGRRDKTLLYVIPPEYYARQEALAYQLPHITVIDWKAEFLNSINQTQRFLNLSAAGELNRLKQFSETRKGILCLINTEYALSRFDRQERELFWRGLWTDFPYSKSIIVFTVLDTPELLPGGMDFELWEAGGRVKRPFESVGGEGKDV